MLKALPALLTALHMLLSATTPEDVVCDLFRSGALLRFHVIAQDDTPEMQRIKLCVRDAVQACYAECSGNAPSMYDRTQGILPSLTDAAQCAAVQAGFSGTVQVTLAVSHFDERTIGAYTLPAGDYPALVIRLGDAQGQNWWGLIDPALSQWFAAIPEARTNEGLQWDWSWRGFWAALLGRPVWIPEGV